MRALYAPHLTPQQKTPYNFEMSASQSDEFLFQSHRNGNFESFEQLYERYKAPVFHFLDREIPSTYEAQKILQIVFLRFHISRKKWNQKYKIGPWIYILTLSEIQKHHHSSPFIQLADKPLAHLSHHPVQKNFKDQLNQTLKSLSPEEELLLHTRFTDGLALEEAAAQLGLSSHQAEEYSWMSSWQEFTVQTKTEFRARLEEDLKKRILKDLKKDQLYSLRNGWILLILSFAALFLANWL